MSFDFNPPFKSDRDFLLAEKFHYWNNVIPLRLQERKEKDLELFQAQAQLQQAIVKYIWNSDNNYFSPHEEQNIPEAWFIVKLINWDHNSLKHFRKRGAQRNCLPKLPLRGFFYGDILDNIHSITDDNEMAQGIIDIYRTITLGLMTISRVQQDSYYLVPILCTELGLKSRDELFDLLENTPDIDARVLEILAKHGLADSHEELYARYRVINAWNQYVMHTLAQPQIFFHYKAEDLRKYLQDNAQAQAQLREFYLTLTHKLAELLELLDSSGLAKKYHQKNEADVEFYITNRMRSIESVTQKQFSAFNRTKLKQEQEIAFLIELVESSLMQQLPIARVAQISEFGDHVYNIGSSCLIPREDSMHIVYQAQDFLTELAKLHHAQGIERPINVLDLCAGSGALGLEAVSSVAKNFPQVHFNLVFAELDSSYSRIVKNNLLTIFKGIDNVSFTFYGNYDVHECEIASTKNSSLDLSLVVKATNNLDPTNVSEPATIDNYDLIICNPPYIPKDDIYLKYIQGDDMKALTDNKDGLSFYPIVIKDALANLRHGGALILEFGHDQAEKILKLIQPYSSQITNQYIFDDYNHLHRGVVVRV